jgi:hypothetical protein
MSHSHTARTIGLSLGALALVLAGCRSAPRRPANVCLGTEYLVVRNDSRETVDVFRVVGSDYNLIGSVAPGRSELQLPGGNAREGYYTSRRVGNGNWVGTSSGGRRSPVAIDIECNTPRV